jgi:hypothetical protein
VKAKDLKVGKIYRCRDYGPVKYLRELDALPIKGSWHLMLLMEDNGPAEEIAYSEDDVEEVITELTKLDRHLLGVEDES